jgi:hypothetical protein
MSHKTSSIVTKSTPARLTLIHPDIADIVALLRNEGFYLDQDSDTNSIKKRKLILEKLRELQFYKPILFNRLLQNNINGVPPLPKNVKLYINNLLVYDEAVADIENEKRECLESHSEMLYAFIDICNRINPPIRPVPYVQFDDIDPDLLNNKTPGGKTQRKVHKKNRRKTQHNNK